MNHRFVIAVHAVGTAVFRVPLAERVLTRDGLHLAPPNDIGMDDLVNGLDVGDGDELDFITWGDQAAGYAYAMPTLQAPVPQVDTAPPVPPLPPAEKGGGQ